ncbi:MAG TPA: ArsR family transcriptional regulator [Deltaproteobacteria bacterium]|nr:ArsR family transcriptional regulator [Deltaproteobacteria bacterium]
MARKTPETCTRKTIDLSEAEYMPNDACKEMISELSKGLAHPSRVEIVRILATKPKEERCICGDIVSALPLAQSSVSQHLKVLKETGWIYGEIEGPSTCYCLVDGILELYQRLVRKILEMG